MFKVRKEACNTCIYREDSPFDIETLENEVRDRYIGFKSFRICHEGEAACCRGFWNRHKNESQLGQIAQRLNFVEYVDE